MKILITGVPGWLGNRFLEVLTCGFEGEGAVNDWQVRCLCLKDSDAAFIKGLSRYKNIEIAYADLTGKESLDEAVRGSEIVFHIAGIIHPRRIKDLYLLNTTGTFNLISAAARQGVKRFIHISSNSVGGTNIKRNILMKEDDPPRPYLNYGLSKYYAEAIVKDFQEKGRIETVILRPCWFYGPHQSQRQTRFFKMLQKGNPIVFGDGRNLRSLSYVDNTIQGMLLAAAKPQAAGQTYWIADSRPYSTIEIYNTVAQLLGVKNFKPRLLPNFTSELFLFADKFIQGSGMYQTEIHVAGEMNKDIACSIAKAIKELGYSPKIGLMEGMRRSIAWCKGKRLL